MIEIPGWIQAFVLGGIALLFVVVPFRVIRGMTRKGRERARKLEDLAARLKGRFEDVRIEGRFPAPRRIRAAYEGRPVVIALPRPDEVALRLEPDAAPRARAIARTRGRWALPFAWMGESFRFLRRVRLGDPLVDGPLAVYASPVFGSYLRELAQDGAGGRGKPAGIVESLVVLRRTPGVEAFELRMSPSGGFRIRFRLRSEDLLYRPEDLEGAAHHAFRLHDLMAMI